MNYQLVKPIFGNWQLGHIENHTAYPLDEDELKTVIRKLQYFDKLIKSASRVRKCQNEYYAEPKGSKRKRAKLIASKEAEKDLDKILESFSI